MKTGIKRRIEWTQHKSSRTTTTDRLEIETELHECYPLDDGSLDIYCTVSRDRVVWPHRTKWSGWQLKVQGFGEEVCEFAFSTPVRSPTTARVVAPTILAGLLGVVGSKRRAA